MKTFLRLKTLVSIKLNSKRWIIKKLFYLGAIFSFVSQTALASDEYILNIDPKQEPPQTRWMYGGGFSETGWVVYLKKAKEAQMAQKFDQCLLELSKIKFQEMRPWVLRWQVECLNRFIQKKGFSKIPDLARVLSEVEGKSEWLYKKPFKELFMKTYIEGKLTLIGHDIIHLRQRAWLGIDDLIAIQDQMTSQQRALLYRYAGELSFLLQKLSQARDFILISLENESSRDLEQKLVAIENAMSASEGFMRVNPSPTPSELEFDGSLEEKNIYNRMQSAFEMGDLVSGVDDGMKLINDYPGSRRSRITTKKLIDTLISVLDKVDKKFVVIQDRIFNQMLKADGIRLWEWARVLFDRGAYSMSLRMTNEALKKLEGTSMTASILLLNAKSSHYLGELSDAYEVYQGLVENHSGSEESLEALFYMGLIDYRLEKYSTAMAHFEKLLILPLRDKWELSSYYFLYRSMQKIQHEKTSLVLQELINKYPLTYYGLLLSLETQGRLNISSVDSNILKSTKIYLTSRQKKSWERLNILLSVGWFEEAQAELDFLPLPNHEMAKIYWAKLWVSALNMERAVKIIQDVWNFFPALQTLEVIKVVYPKEMNAYIESEAQKNELDSDLIRGLIRQESMYNLNAVSSARAMGLMQLMVPTAREMMLGLKMKSVVLPEGLFDPEVNIRLGSLYLKRMLRGQDGHLPLTLAAYNAGPGRMKKWLNRYQSKEEMKKIFFDQDIWIEEIPWSETRFYVKAVIRNALIYKELFQGPVKQQTPVWKALVP